MGGDSPRQSKTGLAPPGRGLDAWSDTLASAAISDADRRAVVESESARSLVLDRAFGDDHDALHGWAMLGRVLADSGASPTLAAHTVDALSVDGGGDWRTQARAVLLEAYVAAQRELAELRIAEAWRFPRCVVRLDDRRAAVAAYFPEDEPDAVAKWADEVAAGLAKMGIRSVHVEGTPRARAALADALASFDIDLTRVRT